VLDKADGWDYSVEAARAGAAHSYIYHDHPGARAEEIAAAEQEAKAAGLGLWGPPASARRLQFRVDERELRYSVRSTTVAPAAFLCTDSTPFFALAFDS
jgi:endonuclease YncB( thermonuclease family)